MSVISQNPPSIQEHHVRLPDQLACLLRAKSLHQIQITGQGVKVAVIDSGFFPHPFYQSQQYKIRTIPTIKEPNPEVDEYGHGTAQLSSLFAVSPEVEVLGIKCMDRDPSQALEVALSLNPNVISCAWGFNIDYPGVNSIPRAFRRMQKLILKAVDQGICVVAAGGNGQCAFPGSMPEVLAAGGVYYSPSGEFQTSDVSSKFRSNMFPGRVVPDVCGLVGNLPHGRLLLVPVPPRSKLARRPSFSTIAAGDSQDVQKGWAMFSGTSAATAMLSGACALLLQKMPNLRPRTIKKILIESSEKIPNMNSSDPEKFCRLLNIENAFKVASAVAE